MRVAVRPHAAVGKTCAVSITCRGAHPQHITASDRLSGSVQLEAVAFHRTPSLQGGSRLDALTLVHVADALADPSFDANDPEAYVDTVYLGNLSLMGQLAGWHSFAERTFEMEKTA